MAEMKDSREFSKSVTFSNVVMTTAYVLTGTIDIEAPNL